MMLKKIALVSLISLFSASVLTGCGFQLRGYQTPNQMIAPKTKLIFGTSATDIAVKNALKQQLNQLGVTTIDGQTSAKGQTPHIQVTNIRLNTYQLRGLLTEIRLVMTADVNYQVVQNGELENINNNIQVQRSYQYDQATLATDNPQADQITLWLYDNLAERIVNQYVALNMPK